VVGGSIGTVFVDVGGTLLPNGLLVSAAAHQRRLRALSSVLASGRRVPRAELAAPAPEATAALVAGEVDAEMDAAPEQPADALIASALAAHGFELGGEMVRRARQALCVPLAGNLAPFEHAPQLLSAIKDMGLGCVVVSNTTFRDAELYRQDFEAFGWDGWVDGYVTSVDAGCCKPDERMFRLALDMAATPPERCVMVGNSEEADIVPALRLGMQAIRVAIEEPAPAVTAAGACVTGLDQAARVLRAWAGAPQQNAPHHV